MKKPGQVALELATVNGQIGLVYLVVVPPASRGIAVPFTPDGLPGSHSFRVNPVDILALIQGMDSAWHSASPGPRQLSKEDVFSPKHLARLQTEVLFENPVLRPGGLPYREFTSRMAIDDR